MMRLTFSEICTSEEEEEDWGEGRGDNRGMNVQLSGRRGEGEWRVEGAQHQQKRPLLLEKAKMVRCV